MSHNTPTILIFSDLDGTLLDHETYQWKEADEALNLCRSLRVPVILVSSKTRAEMEVIHRQLGLEAPFVSENGGGIFFPKARFPDSPFGTFFAESGSYWKWPLGTAYPDLVKAMNDIRKKTGWTIRGFSDMTIKEIAALTGLSDEEASLASQREFDEPFLIPDGQHFDLRLLEEEIKKEGLRLSLGGRFYHLHGYNDKGEAVEHIIDWYGKTCSNIITVALGDSPNDLSMLERVTYPVLVRSPVQKAPVLNDQPRKFRITRKTGPGGWNEAVLDILKENLVGGNT